MRRRGWLTTCPIGFVLALVACTPQQLAERGGGTRRLSIATGGTGGVYYPYGGAIAKVISENLPGVEATAEVTAASVDNLKFLRDGKSDLAFTLADTLADATKGTGAFEQFGRVPARALAVLYVNYTHVVTQAGSGIDSLADLRGKVVSTGSAGSGTEVIAFRVLQAVGLNPETDVRRHGLGVAQSVDAMKDGKLDAFFWSGGLPTAAVLDLANTRGLRVTLLSNSDVLPALQRRYGATLYSARTISRSAYPGLEVDVPVVAVANLLVVHEKMPEELAYDITRLLFEKQPVLASIHPEARNLTLESAVAGSPAPFHEGAIRYYRERRAWEN